MSEKPEALRLAEELYAFHAAKKEMPSVGGQMLGLERYRIVASGEAFSQIRDAAAKLIRQHTEIERLRELLSRTESALDVLAQTICDVEEIVGVELTVKAEAVTELATEVQAALRREDV